MNKKEANEIQLKQIEQLKNIKLRVGDLIGDAGKEACMEHASELLDEPREIGKTNYLWRNEK